MVYSLYAVKKSPLISVHVAIYHLTKLSKIRISEKWDMTNELMNNVRLRGVQRVGTMSDILSSMEDSEGKSSKEVT